MIPLTEYLKILELPVLVDLLVKYTTDYTRMFLDKEFHNEFDQCKSTIELIQKEINLRTSPGSMDFDVHL